MIQIFSISSNSSNLKINFKTKIYRAVKNKKHKVIEANCEEVLKIKGKNFDTDKILTITAITFLKMNNIKLLVKKSASLFFAI